MIRQPKQIDDLDYHWALFNQQSSIINPTEPRIQKGMCAYFFSLVKQIHGALFAGIFRKESAVCYGATLPYSRTSLRKELFSPETISSGVKPYA